MLPSLALLVGIIFAGTGVVFFPSRSRPIGIAGPVSALCIGAGVYLIPMQNSQALDHAVGIVGIGRWRHVALAIGTLLHYMVILGLFRSWSWRRVAVVVPLVALLVAFGISWGVVSHIHTVDRAALFYSAGTGRPLPVFIMNLLTGAGIAYVCALAAFEYARHSLRGKTRFKRALLFGGALLMGGGVAAGMLTIAEAIASNRGWADNTIHAMEPPFAVGDIALSTVSIVFLTAVASWKARRQGAHPRERTDIMDLTTYIAQLRAPLHLERSADRAAVRDVYRLSMEHGYGPEQLQATVEAVGQVTYDPVNIGTNEDDPRVGLEPYDPYLRTTQTVREGEDNPVWEATVRAARRLADGGRIALHLLSPESLPEVGRRRERGWRCDAIRLAASVLRAHEPGSALFLPRDGGGDCHEPVDVGPSRTDAWERRPLARRGDTDAPAASRVASGGSLRRLRSDLVIPLMVMSDQSMASFPSERIDRAILRDVYERMHSLGLSSRRCQAALEAARYIMYSRNTIVYGSLCQSRSWAQLWEQVRERAETEDVRIAATMWQYVTSGTYFLANVGRICIIVLTPSDTSMGERPKADSWHRAAAQTIADVLCAHGHPSALAPTMGCTSPSMVGASDQSTATEKVGHGL